MSVSLRWSVTTATNSISKAWRRCCLMRPQESSQRYLSHLTIFSTLSRMTTGAPNVGAASCNAFQSSSSALRSIVGHFSQCGRAITRRVGDELAELGVAPPRPCFRYRRSCQLCASSAAALRFGVVEELYDRRAEPSLELDPDAGKGSRCGRPCSKLIECDLDIQGSLMVIFRRTLLVGIVPLS